MLLVGVHNLVPLTCGGVFVGSALELRLLRREAKAVVEGLLEGGGRRAGVPHESGYRIAFVEEVCQRKLAECEVSPPLRLALAVVVEQQPRQQPALRLLPRVLLTF